MMRAMKGKTMGNQAKVTKENPEDRRMREEGLRYASRRGPDFTGARSETIAKLVTTYNDQEAHELLDRLRESFWTGEWE